MFAAGGKMDTIIVTSIASGLGSSVQANRACAWQPSQLQTLLDTSPGALFAHIAGESANVSSIALANNHLAGTLPSSLRKLSSLQ